LKIEKAGEADKTRTQQEKNLFVYEGYVETGDRNRKQGWTTSSTMKKKWEDKQRGKYE
jgi:hypothetical protein